MARRPTKKAAPREFDVLIERDADGWLVGTVPAFRGCRTQAQSLDELTIRVREAFQLCLEVEGAPAVQLEFVGVQRVRVA
jgi:predicted RNase H-like HicB family nuclease